jgi:hypothetical protein
MSTPRLALPYIQVQQTQKEVAHSEGLVRLDALVRKRGSEALGGWS